MPTLWAAKVVVYAGQNDGKRRPVHVTRVSAEAYKALQEWKDYRLLALRSGYRRVVGYA